MGKHHDKIAAALEVRKANHKSGQGGKVPGSMNKKKTGYRSIKSNEAKRLLSNKRLKYYDTCAKHLCMLLTGVNETLVLIPY